MKAMMLTGIRRMEMREVANPVISNDTDVLITMAAVGVCGSDVHYYTTGRIGSQVVRYPFTVGHEGAGTVMQTGAKVDRVKPGDRVAVDPAMSCYQCDQCRIGRHHTCRKLRFLGCPGQAEGCLSEYIVMPQESCFPIPASMGFDDAAFSEPLAIGYYAVKRSGCTADSRVAILGAGPIGLSVLLCLKAQGCPACCVTEPIPARRESMLAAGAALAVSPAQDAVGAMLAWEPGGFDVVFECCGKQEALDQAIELLKPGGRLMLIGIPEVDRVSFSIDLLRRREIEIFNVRRQVGCVEPALTLIETGRVVPAPYITHRYPLERCPEAFDLVEHYGDGVMKAMITIG